MAKGMVREKTKSKGKKGLALIGAGLLVLALLAGCGEDSSTADEAVGQEQQAEVETSNSLNVSDILSSRVEVTNNYFQITPEAMKERLNLYITDLIAGSVPAIGELQLSEDETMAQYMAQPSDTTMLLFVTEKDPGEENPWTKGIKSILLGTSAESGSDGFVEWLSYAHAISQCLDPDYPDDIYTELGLGSEEGFNQCILSNYILYNYVHDQGTHLIFFVPDADGATEIGEMVSVGGAVGAAATVEPGTEYELGAGIYVVGEDIPAGKYDVQWISGTGNCFAGEMKEIFGDNPKFHIQEFQNLLLQNGDEVEITLSLKVKLIAQ